MIRPILFFRGRDGEKAGEGGWNVLYLYDGTGYVDVMDIWVSMWVSIHPCLDCSIQRLSIDRS